MTGEAGGFVRGGTVRWKRCDRHRRAYAFDLESRIVLSRHSDVRCPLEALFDALDEAGISGDLLALIVRADVARECEQANRHGKQNAENQTEIVEEMGVLFAHGGEVYLCNK
jgi:hypothetical protein